MPTFHSLLTRTALSLSCLVAFSSCSAEKTADQNDNTQTNAHTNTHTEATVNKSVNFLSPANDDKVKSPVKVIMQAEGMKVEASGEIIPDSGHHHLIIDGESIPEGQAVPKDATHIHFGKGQNETELELAPGKHTLTLQFANGAHLSYGKNMAATITVEVVE